jgi:hypothetical protein
VPGCSAVPERVRGPVLEQPGKIEVPLLAGEEQQIASLGGRAHGLDGLVVSAEPAAGAVQEALGRDGDALQKTPLVLNWFSYGCLEPVLAK